MERSTESESVRYEIRDRSNSHESGRKTSANSEPRYSLAPPTVPFKVVEQNTFSTIEILKEVKSDNPSNHERQILEDQLSIPSVKVSYPMLYRYASWIDVLIIVLSVGCAMASGVECP